MDSRRGYVVHEGAPFKRIWSVSDETYGRLRVHAALRAEGWRVSRKRVARLLQELGISRGVTRRRFKTGTTRDAQARSAPDLGNPGTSRPRAPTGLCVAEITEVRTLGRDGCISPWCSTRGGRIVAGRSRPLPMVAAARREFLSFIEGFYNTRRLSTPALGYKSPTNFEKLNHVGQAETCNRPGGRSSPGFSPRPGRSLPLWIG